MVLATVNLTVNNSQFPQNGNLRSFWNLICFSCRNGLAIYGAWLQINTVHKSVILYQQYFFSTVDKWWLLSHCYLTGYNTSTHVNENDWTLVNGQITWIYMHLNLLPCFKICHEWVKPGSSSPWYTLSSCFAAIKASIKKLRWSLLF